MLKKAINHFLTSTYISRILIRTVLKVHGLLYKLAGGMAIQLNGGVHPKHRIIQYEKWFLDNVSDTDVVLDIGCNIGMMTKVLGDKAKFIYGIEIESKHIEVALNKMAGSNIEYICYDATKYDYSKCRPVDVITLSNVLEHIENRVGFLKKIVQQVKWNSGVEKKLLLRVPMIDRSWITVYKKELGVEYRLDNTHCTEYTFDSFSQELQESGISITSYRIKFGEIYAVCKAD